MPAAPSIVIFSWSSTAPNSVAQAGLSAQNRPARSALVWLWATGYSVKPKPVHTMASASTIPHSIPV